VAKRRRTRRCPTCKLEIKADRLESHMKTAHGDKDPVPVKKIRANRRAVPPILWPAIAVIAVVVVASVGIYYLNRPSPEEPGTDIDNNFPPTDGIFPTKYARIDTASGAITLELYGNETPKTVENFVNVANMGWYGGTIFHRVMKGFMIQGGGYTQEGFQQGQGNLKPTILQPIKLEISEKVKNWRGYIAMARTNDPNSATTQFFINLVDNSKNLGPGGVSTEGYAAFGKVIGGMDVVDSIASTIRVSGPPGGEQSQPINDDIPKVVINSVTTMDSRP
jgi:peptidyl-prolyl cis-trans isomerase A (cyclophilin A)